MKNAIRVIIIDDEDLARARVRRMLENERDFEVVAECSNGKEAADAVNALNPDLLFLDVQMPELDGFQLLENLRAATLPHVVFVTAFNEYALKAFEVHSLDYLLKPFNEERFRKTIKQVRLRLDQQRFSSWGRELLQQLSDLRKNQTGRIAFREDSTIRVVEDDEIDWIEAKDKYTILHCGRKEHLIRESLSALHERLNPSKFVRIHRSTIVNISRIRELQPWFYGEYRTVLKDGTALKMSRKYQKAVQESLGKF